MISPKSRPFEFARKIIRNVEQYLAYTGGCGNDGKAPAIFGFLAERTSH
jgi:hypothetical protein